MRFEFMLFFILDLHIIANLSKLFYKNQIIYIAY